MVANVNEYLKDGCGRCKLYATPDCKVNTWRSLLIQIRPLILDCGLEEEIKWGVPTYTLNGKNVLMLSAFKDYCFISFLKGTLLKDEAKILLKQGKNVQAGRILRFESQADLDRQMDYIKAYIFEAIDNEKAGKKVQLKKTSDFEIVEEVKLAFEQDKELKEAFYSLTPGRQRGYLLYFSGAKQSKTRTDRIAKYRSKILDGKGFHD